MTTPPFAAYRTLSQNNEGINPESTEERILTCLAVIASGENPDGTTWPGLPGSTGVQALNVAEFGAKCDGGVSQTGTLSSAGVLTDTTPSTIPVLAGQTFTWVGPGAATTNGVSGVTQAAGTATVTITCTAHGLSNGTQVTLASVGGCTELDATWPISGVTANSFKIPLNVFALSASYTTGGTVTPNYVVTGFVSDPVITAGTLTFTAVTTLGGSTPVTVPTGVGSVGNYSFGTDDTAAWQAAVSAANVLAVDTPTTVTWTGTSMVSQTINPQGSVLIQGQWMDYTNPDGSNSEGTLPQRGSILRAIGSFASPTTTGVLELGAGGTPILSSGTVGTSCYGGVIDAFNVCSYAIKTVGSRNWSVFTYGLNGINQAFYWAGSNSVAVECIAGQSNTGDGLYVNGTGDCKWKGGYIRQAANGIHLDGSDTYDFYCGNGTHIFSNYNSVPGIAGNNVLISSSGGGQGSFVNIIGVIMGATQGYNVRIAPASSTDEVNTSIIGCSVQQVGITNAQDKVWGFVQLDTSAASSIISGVTVVANQVYGTSASARLKSLIDAEVTGTLTKVNLGSGNFGQNCATFWTGTRPGIVSRDMSLYNGGSTVKSSFQGQLVCTANGTTTIFQAAHSMGAAANAGSIQATIAASSSPVGFTPVVVAYDAGDITNIDVSFVNVATLAVLTPTSGTVTVNVMCQV